MLALRFFTQRRTVMEIGFASRQILTHCTNGLVSGKCRSTLIRVKLSHLAKDQQQLRSTPSGTVLLNVLTKPRNSG